MPKRFGNLWAPICDIENIKIAVRKVLQRRRQKGHWGAAEQYIEDNFETICEQIQRSLKERTYDFGELRHRSIKERKKIRVLDYLDTYHSIYLQCVLNVTQPLFISKYIKTTYSSIKGRGLVQMSKHIRRVIEKHPNYHFMLLDMKKCYENSDHKATMNALSHVFKDKYLLEFFERLLALLPKGVAIGFPTSHYVVNLLFDALDHRLEKVPNVYIFRYMDDILIIAPEELLPYLYKVVQEETDKIGQIIKPNTRFAPIEYGISFCGYVYFDEEDKMKLKVDIVKSMYAKDKHLRKLHVSDEEYKQGMASYWGWCKYCIGNGVALFKSVLKDKQYLFEKQFEEMKRFSDFADPEDLEQETYTGQYWRKPDLLNKEVEFIAFREVPVKGKVKYIVRACIDGVEGYFFTDSKAIKDRLKRYEAELPFVGKIVERPNKFGQLFMTII